MLKHLTTRKDYLRLFGAFGLLLFITLLVSCAFLINEAVRHAESQRLYIENAVTHFETRIGQSLDYYNEQTSALYDIPLFHDEAGRFLPEQSDELCTYLESAQKPETPYKY